MHEKPRKRDLALLAGGLLVTAAAAVAKAVYDHDKKYKSGSSSSMAYDFTPVEKPVYHTPSYTNSYNQTYQYSSSGTGCTQDASATGSEGNPSGTCDGGGGGGDGGGGGG